MRSLPTRSLRRALAAKDRPYTPPQSAGSKHIVDFGGSGHIFYSGVTYNTHHFLPWRICGASWWSTPSRRGTCFGNYAVEKANNTARATRWVALNVNNRRRWNEKQARMPGTRYFSQWSTPSGREVVMCFWEKPKQVVCSTALYQVSTPQSQKLRTMELDKQGAEFASCQCRWRGQEAKSSRIADC